MTGIPLTLVAQRFSRLLVTDRAGTDAHGHALWLCACDCGAVTRVRGRALRTGATRSCGCLRVEKARARAGLGWASQGGRRTRRAA